MCICNEMMDNEFDYDIIEFEEEEEEEGENEDLVNHVTDKEIIPNGHNIVEYRKDSLDQNETITIKRRRSKLQVVAPVSRPLTSLFCCLGLNNPIRRLCISLTEWKPFEYFILANIFATCVVLALTNPDPKAEHSNFNNALDKAELFFTVVFTLEAVLKIIALGFVMHEGAYLRSGWNVLDFTIVVVGVVAIIFADLINVDVKALRALRVLRPLRLVSGVPSLQVVITTIIKAIIPLFYISLLVVFVILMYAVIGVELFRGKLRATCVLESNTSVISSDPDDIHPCSNTSGSGYPCPNGTICMAGVWDGPEDGIVSFDNIFLACLTVFTCVTLEGWTDVMYLVEDAVGNRFMWIYFVSLVLGGSFFVLNLILGVLSGEFAKEKDRQAKSGEFQERYEKEIFEHDVRMYMEWIEKAQSLEDDEYDLEEEARLSFGGLSRGSSYEDSITGSASAISPSVCQRIQHCVKKINSSIRRMLRKCVRSRTFQWGVILAVFLNSVIFAVEHHGEPEYVTLFLQHANYFFVALFTLEMVIKMYSLGPTVYMRSLFNRFDFVIVVASIIEVIVSVTAGINDMGFSVMRCIRLLRVFKGTKYWESLSNLITSLVNGIKSIASLLLLLFLFMVIFSLLGMQIFGGKFNFPDGTPRTNFDTFIRSMLSVFQMLTGEDWNATMYTGINAYGGIGNPKCLLPIVYFTVLVVVGQYILLNLFLAIAVDNLADAENMAKIVAEEKQRKAEMKESRKVEKMKKAFAKETKTEQRRPRLGQIAEQSSSKQSSFDHDGSDGLDDVFVEEEIDLIKNIPYPMPEQTSLFIFSHTLPFRIFCHELCTNSIFINIVLVTICLSSLLLAAEDPLDLDKKRNEILVHFDHLFTGVFTVEILVKIIAFGAFMHERSFCRNWFNLLDLFIVLSSIVAVVAASKQVAVARIIRIVRVLRPLRAINRAPGLKRVVSAVLTAIRSIGNISLVFILLMFMFSIIGVQLFKGCFSFCSDESIHTEVECQGYYFASQGNASQPVNGTGIPREWETHTFNFDNIHEAFLTLFVVMTFEGFPDIQNNAIDSTEEGRGPITDNRIAVALYFMIYIITVAFFMINIFVGFVIVTFTSNSEEKDKFKDCDLNKNQKNCIQYVLNARPITKFVPKAKAQYAIWKVVTSKVFEYLIFGFIIGSTAILAAQYWNMSDTYKQILGYLNVAFTTVFILECILKLFAFRLRQYFIDAWNVFDFIIVVGSILDIVISEIPSIGGAAFKMNFFRLFRALRLLKLLSMGERIRTLLWTFMESIRALPFVSLLVLLMFFIYAVIGMQVFGNIRLNEDSEINRFNNFQTFPMALLLLLRIATGENWQEIMLACLDKPDIRCETDESKNCGNNFAYVYFLSFNMICSFLILNLFVAIIMENFDYLTRDWSVLGPHHLQEFTNLWADYDPDASGKIRQEDLIKMLKQIEPPLGFGKCCPYREVCKRLVNMNMMMYSDGTVDFHTTLFALVRQSLNIKKPSVNAAPSKEDASLRSVIKLMFPRINKDQLDRMIPKPDVKERITIGKYYAIYLIQEYFTRYKERAKTNKDNSKTLMTGFDTERLNEISDLKKWQSESSFEEL